MKVISATNIDLISPFPLTEISHLYNWMRSYKNIVESDLSPKTLEDFITYFSALLPQCISYGVIDRDNSLGFKHDSPIIGIVLFEPNTPWNKYIHIASNRRAWGSGYMDQAITAAINDVFTSPDNPQLIRLSAYVLANNSPVRAVAKRLGWQFEGVMKDMVTQDSVPKSVVHYGLTRATWKERSERLQVADALLAENLASDQQAPASLPDTCQ